MLAFACANLTCAQLRGKGGEPRNYYELDQFDDWSS
jgi:hypothetical protein